MSLGGRHLALRADVSDDTAVRSLVATVGRDVRATGRAGEQRGHDQPDAA